MHNNTFNIQPSVRYSHRHININSCHIRGRYINGKAQTLLIFFFFFHCFLDYHCEFFSTYRVFVCNARRVFMRFVSNCNFTVGKPAIKHTKGFFFLFYTSELTVFLFLFYFLCSFYSLPINNSFWNC